MFGIIRQCASLAGFLHASQMIIWAPLHRTHPMIFCDIRWDDFEKEDTRVILTPDKSTSTGWAISRVL